MSLPIYGRNPVEELFATHPHLIEKITVLDTIEPSEVASLRSHTKALHIPFQVANRKKMESLLDPDSRHQGVIAHIKSFPYLDFDEWLSELDVTKNPTVLLLDEVQDPHNVGASIRVAAAAGMAGVIIPEHRQAPITAASIKASAGAVFRIPVIRIGNTNQTIERLKKAGFWVYGLTSDGEVSLFDYEHTTPAVFIIGNEGSGIREMTLKHCDQRISIPLHNGVESLNASVSVALMAYQAMRGNSKM